MKILIYRKHRYNGFHNTKCGASAEMAREVWAAASYLFFTKGSFSVREIQGLVGLSTHNIVFRSFKVLIAYGYMSRGPVGQSRVNSIRIPLLEMKEDE
jgi:hypothetical protein